ncbi:IS110 family transposase ISCsa3 [Sporomusa carbonis]|uniref:IS110 family transposase n=1 Tax=Sporomusa carbonis TaxID=3076075 RepID=UPI003A6119F6
MRDLLEVCCGLDVHKEVVVACLLKGVLGQEPTSEIREFSTLLSGLDKLKSWLIENNCREVAMESTGVYWFPIYNVLEAVFEEEGGINITVTNPRHMKNVPGKKTDVNDAKWIAGLLRAGLLNASYIPPRQVRELRDWTRYRKTIVQEMTGHKNRVEKYLQQCGFKLSTFLTDIFGQSGISLIHKLCDVGYISPDDVLSHLRGTARKKLDDIKQAVNGRLNEHERSFLSMLVRNFEQCLREIEDIEKKIMECAGKFEEAIRLVETVPGIQRLTAITIISEIGTDLNMFPTAAHLCSWAGMCPGNNESAGKKKSTRLSKGNLQLKNILCQCSWAATRNKKTYLRDWYWKLSRRRGMKKAIIALGRKLLTIIYHMLTTGELYDETRYGQAKNRHEEIRRNKLIAEAQRLGLKLLPA